MLAWRKISSVTWYLGVSLGPGHVDVEIGVPGAGEGGAMCMTGEGILLLVLATHVRFSSAAEMRWLTFVYSGLRVDWRISWRCSCSSSFSLN